MEDKKRIQLSSDTFATETNDESIIAIVENGVFTQGKDVVIYINRENIKKLFDTFHTNKK